MADNYAFKLMMSREICFVSRSALEIMSPLMSRKYPRASELNRLLARPSQPGGSAFTYGFISLLTVIYPLKVSW